MDGKKIRFIKNYNEEYIFFKSSKERVDDISAFQMDLIEGNSTIEDQIIYFLEQFHLNIDQLFLLVYKPIEDLYHNKVSEYKKIWKNYTELSMQRGEEVKYTFNSGVVYASVARFDRFNLNRGINILLNNPLRTVLIYSKKDLIKYSEMKIIFDALFCSALCEVDNPETIELDFQCMFEKICKEDDGVIRYAVDGFSQEIAFFVKKNSSFVSHWKGLKII